MSFFKTKDTDDKLQSKGFGKFGLNHNGRIVLFGYTDKAGKDKSEGHAVDINFKHGEKEYRTRLYIDPKQTYYKDNVQVKHGEDGWDDLFETDMVQKVAVVKHALKCFDVTEEEIEVVSNELDPEDLIKGFQKLLNLAPEGYEKAPVDAFIEWQWSIGKDNNQTFLELPKNMKGGPFLIPSVDPKGGDWTEVRTEKDLHYIDGDGNKHPFKRGEGFINSPKANQQLAGDSKPGSKRGSSVPASRSTASEPSTTEAKKRRWDA